MSGPRLGLVGLFLLRRCLTERDGLLFGPLSDTCCEPRVQGFDLANGAFDDLSDIICFQQPCGDGRGEEVFELNEPVQQVAKRGRALEPRNGVRLQRLRDICADVLGVGRVELPPMIDATLERVHSGLRPTVHQRDLGRRLRPFEL